MAEEVEVQADVADIPTPERDSTAEQAIDEDKPVKTFTEEEHDSIVARRIAKEQRKLTRQAELEAENRLLKQQWHKPELTVDKAPAQDDFGTYEEYLEAKAEYIADKRVEQKLAEREQKQTQSKVEAERNE